MSRRGKSEEATSKVAFEWSYEPFNEHDDCEIMEVLLSCLHTTSSHFGQKGPNRIYLIIMYSWGLSDFTRGDISVDVNDMTLFRLVNGKLYLKDIYVIKFVQNLLQIGGFRRVLQFHNSATLVPNKPVL